MAPHPGPLPASGERGQECSWLGEPGGEAVRVELLVQSRQIRLAHLRAPLRSGTGAPSKRPRAHACARPALVVAKSAITDGVAVSKPTTSSMPASFGSAIVNPFDAIPITTSFAPIPIFWRYAASAWVGWMSPAQVSLSV